MLLTLKLTMCAILLVMVVVIIANQLEWHKSKRKEVITKDHKKLFNL